MRKTKIVTRLIAAVLMVCVIFSGHGVSLLSSAAEKDQELKTQYVKEVKMFYGATEAQAKGYCEAEGYIFCPQDLKESSNSKVKAYLGYKTTKNKGDAITDITLLDMKNSHFNESTYREFLDEHVSDFADQANQIMVLVAEFRKQYAAGSPNAIAAYDSLNMIYMEEDKNHNDTANLLGTYLLEKADASFFEKYTQRGNTQILSMMVNILGNAVSDYEKDGKTWADRAQESDIIEKYQEADSAERNQYDTWYYDPARELVYAIKNFSETYTEAIQKREKYGDTFGYDKEGLNEDSSITDVLEADPDCHLPEYVNALKTYDLLDHTQYGDQTLAEVFVELGKDQNLPDHPEAVYPFIASMSAAQKTVISVAGLGTLAKSLNLLTDYEKDRKALCSDAAKQLKEKGFEDGKIWLWAGVDQSVYDQKVVQTSDAIEAANAGQEITNSTNAAAREAASDLTIALQIIDISVMALTGTFMIVQAIIGVSLYAVSMAIFEMAGLALACGLTGLAVWWGFLGVMAMACWVFGVILLIASLAYLVYSIMDWCGVFDVEPSTDYSKIPNIVFHVRQNQDGNYYVRYDAIQSNATYENMELIYATYLNGGDIEKAKKDIEYQKEIERQVRNNMYGGPAHTIDRFMEEQDPFELEKEFLNSIKERADVSDIAAYQGTKDRWLAVYATKAPACGAPIEVVEGESFIKTQKDDYHVPKGCKAVTLIGGSQAADINSVEIKEKVGTPLYMFMVKGPSAADEEPEVEPEHETKGSDQYVTRVRLAYADSKNGAVNSLKKDGFTDIIDVNLTPYQGYTYLGYQMGSKSGALTDLRVSTMGIDPIINGNSSYARLGLPESGMTPDGMCLYGTSSKEAGTPITRISIETERLPLGSGAEPVCLFSGGNAVDFKHKWSDNYDYSAAKYIETGFFTVDHHYVTTRQDDPEKGGLYIYFWPEEQYKAPDKNSKAPYVSGFSYFMAASDDTADNRYGTHAKYMQKFAEANGFELVYDGDQPQKMMSDKAGKMTPIANWKDCEGGALGHDWRYDMYHFMAYNGVLNFSDGGVGSAGNMASQLKDGVRQTTMYFGVSYTYNPYRAISGIAGLISPYSETTNTLRFGGMNTPAGTMQLCNTSIQGNPLTQPGICYGYFGYTNMVSSMYTNSEAKQKYDIDWLSGGETEVMSHNLLTIGATKGREPIKRDDLKFVSKENPGQVSGYVPLCDMRTPGDYDHPMNLALDTSNLGSQYLYMYMKNSAGGRTGEENKNQNVYQKKHYVAAVFCGQGKTPEAAIKDLYAQASSNWKGISMRFPDISDTPLVTEFDEILPIDLADQTPWYKCYRRDTAYCDPADDEWVRGNDAANLRWGHEDWKTNYGLGYSHLYAPEKTPDDLEHTRDYAYIGVVRTKYAQETATITETDENGNETTKSQTVFPAYAILKYYSKDSPSSVLSVGNVKCNLAGGPIKSKEGQYYLYYSTNKATASFSAPITEIDVSDEAFINGFNTSYSCKSSDRVNNVLPEYSELRMRTDEYKYIHTKFDMQDLPYIEHIYLGVGNNKKEAYADLIGSTIANAASDVNCNYNSYSDKWIAVGYRRTANANAAVKDVFLYSGDNPPAQITLNGYSFTTTKVKGQPVTKLDAGNITYTLVKHNLKKGSEVMSLNEGGGGTGLYLYYCGEKKRIAYGNAFDTEIPPIRNMSFSYGDVSPKHASAKDLAEVYGSTLHGQSKYDIEAYSDPSWEYVLGVKKDPKAFKMDGSTGTPMSLNYGQLPYKGNTKYHANGDKRVIMYVDRGTYELENVGTTKYVPRSKANLSSVGYYSPTTKFGRLTQKGN